MSKQFFSVLLALLRSSTGAWLFGAALAQLLVASSVWALRTDHLPLTGVLLMAVAGWRAPSTDRLAWRVLPIASPQLALARWSIMGPAAGLAMSGALALGAYNNHSFKFPAPALGPQLIALWSAVGYLVWLPPKTRLSYLSVPRVLGVVLVVLLVLLGTYGYPLRPGWRLPCYALMGLGYALLVAALLRILLRLPAAYELDRESSDAGATDGPQTIAEAVDVAANHDAAQPSGSDRGGRSFGWGVVIRPLFTHTGVMSLTCIGAVSVLRRLYPQATEPLSWAFLCVVAAWSGFLTPRWTRSLSVWRCLPISGTRLAVYLRGLASLPAAVTLLLAVAINRLAPEAAIPLPGWVIVAFIGLQAIIDARPRSDASQDGSSPQSALLVETTRLIYPGYVGAALLALFALFTSIQCSMCSQSRVLTGLTWLPNVVAVVAALLLVCAYAITRDQLNSGSERDR